MLVETLHWIVLIKFESQKMTNTDGNPSLHHRAIKYNAPVDSQSILQKYIKRYEVKNEERTQSLSQYQRRKRACTYLPTEGFII
jgi:hypothetical protein